MGKINSHILPSSADKVTSTILQAALSNFAKHGYGGARIDEIARDAGVNKATIYYHIGGKADLYRAIMVSTFTRVASHVRERVAGAAGAVEKLRAYINAVAENLLASAPYFSAVIMRELASGGGGLPKEAFDNMRLILTTMEEILREGAREGSLRAADPQTIHFMIVGGLNFLIVTGAIRERMEAENPGLGATGVSGKALGDSVAELVQNGLALRATARERE